MVLVMALSLPYQTVRPQKSCMYYLHSQKFLLSFFLNGKNKIRVYMELKTISRELRYWLRRKILVFVIYFEKCNRLASVLPDKKILFCLFYIWNILKITLRLLKFIYSEKATKFCEIFTFTFCWHYMGQK